MTDGPVSAALVTGVDFVAVPARDFDASVDFYGTVLGLPFVKRWGEMPGVEFQAGNLTIAVMEPTAFGQEFCSHSLPIALQVSDVPAARSPQPAARSPQAARSTRSPVRDRPDRQRCLPPGDVSRPLRQHLGPSPSLREQPQLDPFGAARTGSGLLPFAHCASGFEAVRRLQMAMEDDHELTVAVHLAVLAVVA
jgi:catechol 2,3-dioxygenase-like lactoylglutathione lyase family enzyme